MGMVYNGYNKTKEADMNMEKRGYYPAKRYLVTTWSRDIGSDEHMDFRTKAEAIKECRKYRKSEEYGAVFDQWNKIAYVVFGDVGNPVFEDSVTVVKA